MHKPIKDRFASARAGQSKFLDISCAKCQSHVVTYQKDGIGSLIRLYLDRILAPQEIAAWQFLPPQQKIPNLVCKQCANLIATPMIYAAENRRALRLIRGAYQKRLAAI
jgi:hypothetical protein